MQTEAQKRAKAKYRKKMNQLVLAFSPNETDLWEFVSEHDNKAGFVKNLIRGEMNKTE